MVAEAVAIGVPLEEVLAHVRDRCADAVKTQERHVQDVQDTQDDTRSAGTSLRRDDEVRR